MNKSGNNWDAMLCLRGKTERFSVFLSLFFLCAIGFFLLANPAFAVDPSNAQFPSTQDYTVEDTTDPTSGEYASGIDQLEMDGSFTCNNGTPSGALFINPYCDAGGVMGLFANVVCRIENLFGNILGLLYCSVQDAVIPPFMALLSLYVVIYGALVLLGMVQNTFREALVRTFKIALVAGIILNANIAIQLGYKFYINMAQTSIEVILSVFTNGDATSTPNFNELVRGGYVLSPDYTDPSRKLYVNEHWMMSLDRTIHQLLAVFIDGGVKLLIVMAALFIFAFPVFLVVVYLIVSAFKALAEAIIGYLLALLGITLLFSVAPIFVCFALFRVTSNYFQMWLQYLASFTLQIMVIFSFLMILIMCDIFTFFQQVGTLVRDYNYAINLGFFYMPVRAPSLCRVERTGTGGYTGDIKYFHYQTTSPITLPDGTKSHLSNSHSLNPYAGFPKCIQNYTLMELLKGPRRPNGLEQEDVEDLRDLIEEYNGTDYENIHADDEELLQEIVNKANEDLVMPLLEALTTADLMQFLIVRFLVVILLTTLLDKFLKKVPAIATHLAGTKFSGRVGGGQQDWGEAPGIQDSRDTAGLKTGFERFRMEGMHTGGRGLVTGAPERFTRSVGGMVSGMASGMFQRSVKQYMGLGLRGNVAKHSQLSTEQLERMREGLLERTSQDRQRDQVLRGNRSRRHHSGGRRGPPPMSRPTRRR